MQKSPDCPNWAPLLINWKQNNITNTIFIELLLELDCVTCTISSSTCKPVLEVSVSHEDSAISHPRDQDYLSLWVGKRYEVELQQATSIYGG